ncbi:hypothetical protein LUZ60_016271 [Juncus effusus]|nr:hypothetical protein LUZ60_016271 [Juncus effusus]
MMTDQVVVDWTKLEPDLVRLIAKKTKKFRDISNFFHFRAVCKAWCAACHVRPFPWLLVHPKESTNHKSMVYFYSVSSGKTYTVSLRSSEAHHNKHLHGPTHVYRLATVEPSPDEDDGANDGAMFLVLNPLTCDELIRPDRPVRVGRNLVKNNNYAMCYSVLQKGISHKYLSFWSHDKEKRTMLRVPSKTWAVLYWRHKFLVLTRNNKRIMVIDETTGAVLSKIIQLPARDIECLISLGEGGLLAVRHNFAGRKHVAKFWFDIYRLDNDHENTHWTKLSEIGDRMLFLDTIGGFSLKASNFHGFRGNCIYFVTRVDQEGGEIKFGLHRYDVRENKTETMPWPTGFAKDAKCVSWFVPSFY